MGQSALIIQLVLAVFSCVLALGPVVYSPSPARRMVAALTACAWVGVTTLDVLMLINLKGG